MAIVAARVVYMCTFIQHTVQCSDVWNTLKEWGLLFGCGGASWWRGNLGIALEVLVLLFVVQSAVPCRVPPRPLVIVDWNLMWVYSERAEKQNRTKMWSAENKPQPGRCYY